MFSETSFVFLYPRALVRGYKTHNEFHKTLYEKKIAFRFFLSHDNSKTINISWQKCAFWENLVQKSLYNVMVNTTS